MKKTGIFLAGMFALVLAFSIQIAPASAVVANDDQVVRIVTARLPEICAPFNDQISSLQQQISNLSSAQPVGGFSQSFSQPTGGYVDTASLEARLTALENQHANDVSRIAQLEQRTGSLEMALDYFNGYLAKFKAALKIK